MAKQQLVQDPTLFVLDSIKRSKSRVFWGNIPGIDGVGSKTQTEVRTETEQAMDKEQFAREQARRTVRLEINFANITLSELIHANTESTTLYKMWYNNAGVGAWTEEQVEAFLKNDCSTDEAGHLFYEISLRETLDGRTRKVADPSKTRAKLAEQLAGKTQEEKMQELQALAAAMGIDMAKLQK